MTAAEITALLVGFVTIMSIAWLLARLHGWLRWRRNRIYRIRRVT